jgi:hypothetical protein
MNGLDEFGPKNAVEVAGDAVDWVRENPVEAAVLCAVGGAILGLTGFGRIYRGVRAVHSMPFISQFALGALVKGLLPKDATAPRRFVH